MSDQDSGRVGVILVGHQGCAAALLRAAAQIVSTGWKNSILERAVVLDAAQGCDAAFAQRLRDAFVQVDEGAGLLILVDLVGSSSASFCSCMLERHRAHLVSGLSLAMLLKLAHLPAFGGDAGQLAKVCADVGRRAIIHLEPNGEGC